MLPYIILWTTKISMFWLWVACSLFVFCYSCYRYCIKYQLDFRRLFFAFPRFFFVIYLVWKIVWFLLSSAPWSLLSLSSRSYILSPNGSDFHYVGVILWSLWAFWLFMRGKTKNTVKTLVDMFFQASMYSSILLWVFLTLSDQVIWLPNDHGWFAMRALVSYSAVSQYGQVYPYGIVISIIAAVSLLSTKLLDRFLNRTGIGYLGFALFFLLMNYGFSYELYDKHGVIWLRWTQFDIKHYLNLFLVVICCIFYSRLSK